MYLLVANVGSTSFKFQLFDRETLTEHARGRLERIGDRDAPIQYHRSDGVGFNGTAELTDYAAAIRYSVAVLTDPDKGVLKGLSELSAIGFKPVHALEVTGCRLFTDDILTAMERATPLAPAHNPPYIAAVRLFQSLLPTVPLYGLFESTFHTTVPDYAAVYAVPQEWIDLYGIRRYGFHGASHWHIAERLPALLNRPASSLRIVSCHLGGSSSLCAIKDGASVDTSMGLTPQSGLPQGNRVGDLDPFAVLAVLDHTGCTTDAMRSVLCKHSGLKGISGVESGDMRDILAAERTGSDRARLAVQAYTYAIRKTIGAYAAAMGGLDAIVFTGGIGERSAEIRRRACEGLAFLGVELDPARNEAAQGEGILSSDEARVSVAVIPANEERIIAREVALALNARQKNLSYNPTSDIRNPN